MEEHYGDVRFRPEVEIRPFRACAVKHMQYTPVSLIIYYRNSSVVLDLLWDRYHVPMKAFLVYNGFIALGSIFFSQYAQYCYLSVSLSAYMSQKHNVHMCKFNEINSTCNLWPWVGSVKGFWLENFGKEIMRKILLIFQLAFH